MLEKLASKAIARSADRLKELIIREAPSVCINLEFNLLNYRLKELGFLIHCNDISKTK